MYQKVPIYVNSNIILNLFKNNVFQYSNERDKKVCDATTY